MTTDNAYVGSQKVLVTPDISGKISKIVVREGQRVQRRRRAVRDRRRAVPPRAAAGGGARRQRPHRSRQPPDQRQGDVAHDRACAEDRRYQAAGRRTQIDADGEPQRLAVRPRLVECAARRRADPGRATEPAAGRHPQPAARQPGAAARTIPALPAGQGRARPGAARPQPYDRARAARRQRHPGRQHPDRPLRQRRHAGAERDRRSRIRGSTPIRRKPISPTSRSDRR